LGWIVLKERLRRIQAAGILLATLGVLLVVTDGDLAALAVGNFGTPGDFLILISALNWAVFSILSRRSLKRFPAALVVFYAMTLGWMFTSLQFIAGSGMRELVQLGPAGWAGVLFLGIFCSGIAYIFWFDALEVLPVAQVGAFVYLEPFITLLVAAWLLSEAIVPASLVGGATILLGVWMVQK
jgi:drug/metabolite transporter (DMT)-like permease